MENADAMQGWGQMYVQTMHASRNSSIQHKTSQRRGTACQHTDAWLGKMRLAAALGFLPATKLAWLGVRRLVLRRCMQVPCVPEVHQ
jgi:hypothetical protein